MAECKNKSSLGQKKDQLQACQSISGKNKGEMPVYTKTGGAINPYIDQTQYIKEQLGPKRTEMIKQLDQEIEDLEKKFIQEDTKIADEKNKQLYLRGRGRERIREHIERQNLLVREREQLAEKLPLRKRLKDLFKKHSFTLATVVTAVGIMIGVLAKMLANGQVPLQMG